MYYQICSESIWEFFITLFIQQKCKLYAGWLIIAEFNLLLFYLSMSLGIDVDVHVDHNGKFETVNTSKPKTEDTKGQDKNQPQDDITSEKTDSASARAEDAPSVPMDTQSETTETEASAATNVYPKLDDAMASTKPVSINDYPPVC